MDKCLKEFIKAQESVVQKQIAQAAIQADVLKAGQGLAFKIEVYEAPVPVIKLRQRKRARYSKRLITPEEWNNAFGMRLGGVDRRVLEVLLENREQPVHSSELANAVGQSKFFSSDLLRLNHLLGKLAPPLCVVTTSRGRSTEDSFWQVAEVEKAP